MNKLKEGHFYRLYIYGNGSSYGLENGLPYFEDIIVENENLAKNDIELEDQELYAFDIVGKYLGEKNGFAFFEDYVTKRTIPLVSLEYADNFPGVSCYNVREMTNLNFLEYARRYRRFNKAAKRRYELKYINIFLDIVNKENENVLRMEK